MRVHHLNCGTMCPVGGHLFDGDTPGLGPSKLACHCFLIESDEGLILVDTGFGLQDIRYPHERLAEFFLYFNNIQLREEDTAVRQVEKLGFIKNDVRHLVFTHLDFDHAGGISDFPYATVHVLNQEYRTARYARSLIDVGRYRPMQWLMPERWKKYEAGGERWFGFDCVRDLEGLPPEILLVPLVGHTFGHCGVAVDTGEGWLLHAGDAYFYRDEMRVEDPYCTPGLKFYQTMMEQDRQSRLWNQERLRQLKRDHGHDVHIICAHDHRELELAQERSRDVEKGLPQPRYSREHAALPFF